MRLVVLSIVFVIGCAKDVRTTLPADAPGDPTGAIVLVLTQASSDVVVAVNGALVVDGAHTKRDRIEGVPTGYADLAIAIGPGEKQVKVWVEEGRDTVLPVGAPGGGSALDGVKSVALSLAAMAIYAWIR
jgi:hypothetical protein